MGRPDRLRSDACDLLSKSTTPRVPRADYWAKGGSEARSDEPGRASTRPPFWDASALPTVDRGTFNAMAICRTLRPPARIAATRRPWRACARGWQARHACAGARLRSAAG